MRPCIDRNIMVSRVPKANITNIKGVMACLPQVLASCPREVRINKKSHGVSLWGRQRVMFFLFNQLARIGQGGPHIFFSHPILVSNPFDGHPTGQSPNEPHNWDPRTTDDRLPMVHVCINNNALSHLISLRDTFLHRTEEMQKSQSGRKGLDWLGYHLSPVGLRLVAQVPG